MVGIVLKGMRSVQWFLAGGSEHLHAVEQEAHGSLCPAVYNNPDIVHGTLN